MRSLLFSFSDRGKKKFCGFSAIIRSPSSYVGYTTQSNGARWPVPPLRAARTPLEEDIMAKKRPFPVEDGAAVSREALVEAAMYEITSNYREACLSNVARAYGVSLAYVSECVHSETGRTYKELLQKHRIETAARLLRRSDQSVQQIIDQVGYENTSYFYRLFHQRYGQSPREYRLARTRPSGRRTEA